MGGHAKLAAVRRPACGDARLSLVVGVGHHSARGRSSWATPAKLGSSLLLLALALSHVLATGCAPRPRMCTAASDCTNNSACVAGRCQVEKATAKPAVDSARRLVVRPVDIAYVKRGDGPSDGALPTVFVLGKDGGKLFLRFSVAVPSMANIVEAYVVLRRASVVDDDPAPVSLHATRIVDSWEGGSVSWAIQPRSTETRSPSTTVEPGARSLVRLDVRELVRNWARRDLADQGIAIVAENETRSGSTFALTATGTFGADRASTDPVGASRVGPSSASGAAPDVEPYLELYVR
ncbi:MAG: hypothetical protein BGO98_48340 [Myxococcales bacterium 68-20]|nr:DNRLRE domain-containing protein [Myxococcales bacterium]OJY29648.1 MAG: hypothetical protein BGO98_48340 [Myxococcales bacterium 68-20]